METLFRDLRYSLRLLLRSPGFAVAGILLLALGIGANTTVFTLTDSVLLRPLPVPHPEQLKLLRWFSSRDVLPDSISGYVDMGGEGRDATSTSFSYEGFEAMRRAGGEAVELVGFAELESLNLRIDESNQIASAQLVSGNYFQAMGVRPELGRALTPEDDREENPAAVAVASTHFWERTLGGDPGAVGRTVTLNGRPFLVVGVAPREFVGTLQVGREPDLYLPLTVQPLLSQDGSLLRKGGTWWVQILGRLSSGTSVESARARLDSTFRGIARLGLAAVTERDLPRLELEDGSRGQPEMRQEYVQPLLVLSGMAALMLLIACANLASLLLGRAPARRQEMAVRAALGAGRWRLVRQLLTESLLLGVFGGGLGYVLAIWASEVTARLLPAPAAPGGLHVEPDLRTFAFMSMVSLAVGVLSGLAPALKVGRARLAPDLKSDTLGGGRRLGLGGVFVGIQVAVSLVLLFGAGLFVRTLRNLEGVNPGFSTENLLVFKVEPSLIGYRGQQLVDLYGRIASRLEALPGVRSVTFSRNGLLQGSASITRIAAMGKVADPDAASYSWMMLARANFLPAMGIPLIHGRGLEANDETAARPVAVINESLARRLFGDREAVGQKFSFVGSPEETAVEVVGVAGDAHYDHVRGDPPPSFYTPFTRQPGMAGRMTFAVRTHGDPMAILPAVRRVVAEAGPELPLFEARTMAEQADQSILRERQFALLATGFGAAALLLACVGLYGVLSYAVQRRSREIGIRLALGAAPGRVLRMVLWQAALPTAAGCMVGLAAALATARLVSGMLFGIAPWDPLALTAATALLALTAMLAACLPALRAARTDPMEVLRYE